MKKFCKKCGQPFLCLSSYDRLKKRFCSKSCANSHTWKKRESCFQKGMTPWNKGRKCPEISLALKKIGYKPKNSFEKGQVFPNEGRKFSAEWRRKIGESNSKALYGKYRGKKSPHWKGG